MTRQHKKTPEIIRLRILASLVSWPRLGCSLGPLLPFMITYALHSALAGRMPVLGVSAFFMWPPPFPLIITLSGSAACCAERLRLSGPAPK